MFPAHCKEVSVHSVKFDLTEEAIGDYLTGRKAYIRTRFVVLNRGGQWAVASVDKESRNCVLQVVSSVTMVSLPRDTTFVDDPSLDVLSASEMGRIQETIGTRCVVVRGRSEHVSFFVEEDPFEMTVFDVIPPSPTKLVGLVEEALRSLLQDRYLRYDVIELDLNALGGLSYAKHVLFPCRASGLDHVAKLGYMDDPPELTPEQLGQVQVVGCSLTARVFQAVYGSEPRLINMCPVDLLADAGVEGPVLTKCCKVKEGFEIRGNVAVVPWGARVTEVADALKALIDQMSS
jgi:hypothetical protein